MYRWIRSGLFCLPPERAHEVALNALHYIPSWFFPKITPSTVQVMGFLFAHPVGLAAGLDKNGEHIEALAKLGFSHIEVGTVTPRPQRGNPLPRLFRIPEAHALINRMGFNNHGVDALLKNIKKARFDGILGVNIGKNKDTPLASALEDYWYCLRKVYLHAAYITVNISSPNTEDLRLLQTKAYFNDLMSGLREEQLQLADKYQRYVPLVIKISPDERDETLKQMADVIVSLGIDGIIATNTTCDHQAVSEFRYGNETGGLSGRPLLSRSTRSLRILKSVVGNQVALIASGGIDSPLIAREKLQSGASLLQVYTGLIYQGPSLVRQLVNACRQ